MGKTLLLFLLLFGASSPGWAQFEEDDATDSLIDELENELPSEKAPKIVETAPGSDAFDSDAFNKSEVKDDELKKLSEARKARSESNLVKAASAILSKDPNHLQALNTMGVYYFDAKKFGLAKIIFKRALKSHPNEPALHNNLGVVYLAEDDLRLAIDSFKKSVQARADYKIGATNLSSIYVKYRDFKASLAPLQEAYEVTRSDLRRGSPEAVEIANNYGVALLGVGENKKAEKVFEELTSTSVRAPAPYLNYAIMLVEVLKQKKDAIRIISKLKFMTDDRAILRRVEEIEKKME